MRFSLKKFLVIAAISASIAMSSRVYAQETSKGEKAPATNVENSVILPQLADIIPAAAELSVRLAILESKVKDGINASTMAEKYDKIQTTIDGFTTRFQQLKESNDYKQNKLVDLGDAIKQESKSFEETSRPIKQAIRQLEEFRAEWLSEKKRWYKWQEILSQEKELDQLKSTFEKAKQTIDAALHFVIPQLESMFRIQEKGGIIDARLKILANELAALIAEERRGTMAKEFPPMVSFRFFSQFTSSDFWSAIQKGWYEASWPVRQFSNQQGWIFLFQGMISLLVIITIFRNRSLLEKSKRWHFLARRFFSAGLFLGYMTTVLIYENQGTPVICKKALSIVGVISFARLFGGLIEVSWKKHFVYGLMTVSIVATFMEMFGLPLPLFRVYTVATALVSILFCMRWVRECVHRKESSLYSWGLRLAALFFLIIAIAEMWGKATLPFYLLTSLLRSTAAVLFFMLFMHVIRGGLELLLRTSFFRRMSNIDSEIDDLVRRISLFINVPIWVLVVVPAVFVIWGFYDTLNGAATDLLGLGFSLGAQRISVGSLIIATGFIYSSFFLSWFVQKLFLDEVLLRRKVERGVRASIKRLTHYFILSIGFLLAISSLGLELTKLTIMLSALGVGIGFGLQGIVNNFVSGLILLFERPVRVGDYIELNGNLCEIEKIGLRATTVQTFDQADVIIPNADLVNNQVTNWTLGNRRTRLIIPVGVAYGSDIPLVIETLKAVAAPHPMVAKNPAPQVLFLSFGDSSLGFELRVWVLDVDQKLTTQSELHQEIDRRFREAKIEIAFPQLDLHFRSVAK